MRIHAEGVEAFIYNTTPTYDEIVRRMEKHEATEAAGKEPGASETWSSNESHDGMRKRSSVRRSQTKGSSGSSSNGERRAKHGLILTCRFEGFSQRYIQDTSDGRTESDRANLQLLSRDVSDPDIPQARLSRAGQRRHTFRTNRPLLVGHWYRESSRGE